MSEETKKIRIKDYTGEKLYHPETEADIVIRGNSNVDADLEAVESDVEALESQVGGLETELHTLEGTVEGIGSDVVALQGDVEVLESDVAELQEAVQNIAVYDMVKDGEAAAGYAATYHLTKDNVAIGAAINIPKDFFVHDVHVYTCEQDGVPEELPNIKVGDKYIDFEVNIDVESGESASETKHVYLAVSDLFIPYTAGEGIVIDGTTISVDASTVPSKEELTALLAEKQDTLVSGSNIVTINGHDLLESGDLNILTYQPFPDGWPTANATFEQLLAAVAEEPTAVKGMAYLDEVARSLSGKPFDGNAELQIEVMSGTATPSSKVLHAVITSGNVPPYRWEYTAWDYSTSTHTFASISGWIGYQPELTAGNGVAISDNTISTKVDGETVFFDENGAIAAKGKEYVAGDNIVISEESTESGEVETVIAAPDAWTRTNLREGKNIEIVQKTNPNVIDEYTFMVMNFADCAPATISRYGQYIATATGGYGGTTTGLTRTGSGDATLGNSITLYTDNGSSTFTVGSQGVLHWGRTVSQWSGNPAFIGNAGCNGYATAGVITKDFWFKWGGGTGNQTIAVAFAPTSGSQFEVRFERVSSSAYRLYLYNVSTTVDKQVSSNLFDGEWHHVAVTFSAITKKLAMYMDGHYIETLTINVNFNNLAVMRNNDQGLAIYGGSSLDEYRISIADRYQEEDYEVPTEPYAVSASSDWYVINNTLTAGTNISISNEGVINNTLDISGKQDVLTAGTAVDLTSNTLSVKVDGTTITTNAQGQLTLASSIGYEVVDESESI